MPDLWVLSPKAWTTKDSLEVCPSISEALVAHSEVNSGGPFRSNLSTLLYIRNVIFLLPKYDSPVSGFYSQSYMVKVKICFPDYIKQLVLIKLSETNWICEITPGGTLLI